MDTEKDLEAQNPEIIAGLRVDATINQLSDMFGKIRSIKNVLSLLYGYLSGEQREIAEVSSAMVVCISLLDEIYYKSDDIFDTLGIYRHLHS